MCCVFPCSGWRWLGSRGNSRLGSRGELGVSGWEPGLVSELTSLIRHMSVYLFRCYLSRVYQPCVCVCCYHWTVFNSLPLNCSTMSVSDDMNLHWNVFMVNQVSARPSLPKRNVRRGGKNWRQNGRSAKLLKVLWNWVHASWTDQACRERCEGGNG